MDLKQIRDESIQEAKRLGVTALVALPLLEVGLEMKGVDETVSRILTMHALAATAYGFEKTKAVTWLNQEALAGALDEQEKHFLFEGVGQPDQFKMQIEGMWALTWAMGIVNELNFAKDCDQGLVMLLPNLKQSEPSANFRMKANPRPLMQVTAACDLAYCLHSAIRESQITGKPTPGRLDSVRVIERRRALEWLLSKKAWNKVSLDT
jgi:hypothetical protein